MKLLGRVLTLFSMLVPLVLPAGVFSVESAGDAIVQRQDSAQQTAASADHVLGTITVTATKTETPVETLPVTGCSVGRATIEAQPDFFRNDYGQ